jgi:multiple sugar transport system substrate-binding protein
MPMNREQRDPGGRPGDGRWRTRRRLLAPGGAAGVALLAGACAAAGGGAEERAAPGAPGSAPATVTLMSRSAEEEAFTRRAAEFGAAHPRVRLEYQALPGAYPEVVRTNAAAGTLADAIYLQNLLFEGLVVSGDLLPVDALVRRDKVDLGQWYETGIKGFTLEGKLYGLPARGQIQDCYLYFNRDAFGRAGVREPDDRWTLDELVTAADRLTLRGQEVYGYATTWGSFQHAIAAVRRFGGDVLSPDGRRSLLDRPEALQAMQWQWDLWHRRQVALPRAGTPADFGAGTVAMLGMMLAGQRSAVRAAVKESFKWTMVLLPTGPTGKLGADTSLAPVSLNARSKALDQSWQVARWFTDKETGVALALQKSGSNTPGMRKDVYCDERVLADPDYPREMLERVCRAMDLAPTVPYSVPHNFRQPEVEAVMQRHLNAFLANEVAPGAAVMRTFHTDLQTVLDLPRAGG